MARFESLVVVGPLGGGKSTAVEILRGTGYAHSVVLPLRRSTTLNREGIDDPNENLPMERGMMEEGIAQRLLYPYWEQPTDIGKKPNLWAFVPPAEDDDRLPIYSANNAMLRDDNPSVQKVLDNALLVVVTASREVRRERLIQRFGDAGMVEKLLEFNRKNDDLLPIGGPVMTTIDTSIPTNRQHGRQQMISLLVEEFGITPELL